MAEFDPLGLLRSLTDNGVEFVLIGGVAARLRGAPLLTQDVDITPAVTSENLERLVAALKDLDARLRTATDPEGVAFPLAPEMIEAASIWTLTTRAGDLDLVITPDGTGGYADLIRGADRMVVSLDPELEVAVASLADVIRSKAAAGREKDLAALPLLRRTLDET
ncbi:MAG: hypothetical protein OEY62_02565 [Acidimicrobiia bacterium]|nr:hypothetical protein [Acidimicrobiia bacterium]